MGKKGTFPDRFWAKVDKTDPSGCWIWTGAVSVGYGSIGRGTRQEGTMMAHRASWLLHHGSEASGLVCHTCDNRLCVNPAHLFLGTHADNSADMTAKGRFPSRGRRSTKLSDADVAAIASRGRRERYGPGERHADLAAEFGVTRQTIQYAIAQFYGTGRLRR
jgi:hypothetical protein